MPHGGQRLHVHCTSGQRQHVHYTGGQRLDNHRIGIRYVVPRY
jgi:hypothetical protein